MEITNSLSNTQSSQSAAAATSSTSDKGLGKDAFLKLLVAQLRNQNPLNPLQGTDFIAQTAQFTSLEQLQQINTSLAALAASSAASNGGSSLNAVLASNYIGKLVEANGTIIELGEGAPATLHFNLPSAASVQIQVRDLQGNLVKTMSLGAQPSGQGQTIFDGLADDGHVLPSGRYMYKVIATDADGREVVGVRTASGLVTGLSFEGDEPLLMVGGDLIPLKAILQVSLAS